AQNDSVFYIAVKSEDQQSADYGLFAVATDENFSDKDEEGNSIVRFFSPQLIPDGAPNKPEAALLFAFVNDPMTVQNILFTNSLTHDQGGDLFGNLGHDGRSA